MDVARALADLPASWSQRALSELRPRVKEFRRGVHSFRQSAIAMAGLIIISAFLIIAMLAPLFAPPVAGNRDPFEMVQNESEAWCPPATADSERWAWQQRPAPGGGRGAEFELTLPPVAEDAFGRFAWFEVNALNATGRPIPVVWTLNGGEVSRAALYKFPLDTPGEAVVKASVTSPDYNASYTWHMGVPAARATHLIVLSPKTSVRVTPAFENFTFQILQIRVCNQALVYQGEALKPVAWAVDGGSRGARPSLPLPSDGASHTIEASYSRPAYPFGQTDSGMDVYYGVVWGSRISMRLGLEVVLVAIVIGSILGILAGYHGRWIDEALMRVTDVFFGLPGLILAMTVIVSLGPTLDNLVLALVIVAWPGYARLIRGVTLTVKTNLYVEAARAGGTRAGAIMRRHVFPNTFSPIMVQATLDIGSVVLTAAGLSFIGFSFVTPNTGEWGRMVFIGQQQLGASTGEIWWPVLYPGLFIFLFVLGFNMLGDGLRDVLDPRLRR